MSKIPDFHYQFGCIYCTSIPLVKHHLCTDGKFTKKDKRKIICHCKACHPKQTGETDKKQ